MNLKLTLADNWRQLHKRGTVIAGAAFTALVGAGPLIAQAWAGMPAELKAAIPQNVQQWIGYTAFGLGFLALRYTSVRRAPKEGGVTVPVDGITSFGSGITVVGEGGGGGGGKVREGGDGADQT